MDDIMAVMNSTAGWLGSVEKQGTSVARRSTADRVADVLRSQIAAGAIPPGTQLGEEQLTQAINVSRHTLRESFRLLSQERLLVHVVNRGMFVRSLSVQDIRDVYGLRRLSERYALETGMSATTEIFTERMKPVWHALTTGEQASRADDSRGMGTADLEFHQAIIGLAASPRLSESATQWMTELRLAFHEMPDALEWHRGYLRRNVQLAEVIASGDVVEATRLLADYLDEAEADLLTGQDETAPVSVPPDGV